MPRYTIPVPHPIGEIRVRTESFGQRYEPVPEPPPLAPEPPPYVPPPQPAPPDPEEMRQLLAHLGELVQEHEQRRQESLGELQQLAVELAVAVASRVVHQAIDENQFGVRKLVDGLLDRLGLAEPVAIGLHPRDLELLEEHLVREPPPPEWDARLLKFVPDPGLARGSGRATSARGEILSEAALHLAELRRHLLEGLDDAEIERRHTSSADQRLRRFPDRRETA